MSCLPLQVVSNFGISGEIDAYMKMGSLVAHLLTGAHFLARVYFTGIDKSRDYSQSRVASS